MTDTLSLFLLSLPLFLFLRFSNHFIIFSNLFLHFLSCFPREIAARVLLRLIFYHAPALFFLHLPLTATCLPFITSSHSLVYFLPFSHLSSSPLHLLQHFRLQQTQVLDITRLAGGQNGIVYRLAVAREPSLRERDSIPAQPATTPLPADTTTLVIRLSDPAAMLNEAVRVQNEVALMSFMREALASITPSIVPAVYAWGKSIPGDSTKDYVPGWVVLEHMPGIPLGPAWESLGDDTQKHLLQQIATAHAGIQSYELPASIKQYGGLNFNDEGHIIVGATPIDGTLVACDSHTELYLEYMKTILKSADKCDIVKGWHDTNLRSRIEAFASQGLRPMLEKAAAKTRNIRPTLVHGDFGKLHSHPLLLIYQTRDHS